MTDYATARADIERHVERAVSPRRALQNIGEAFVRVCTDTLGTGPTEEITAGMFRQAAGLHARRRGGRS